MHKRTTYVLKRLALLKLSMYHMNIKHLVILSTLLTVIHYSSWLV